MQFTIKNSPSWNLFNGNAFKTVKIQKKRQKKLSTHLLRLSLNCAFIKTQSELSYICTEAINSKEE